MYTLLASSQLGADVSADGGGNVPVTHATDARVSVVVAPSTTDKQHHQTSSSTVVLPPTQLQRHTANTSELPPGTGHDYVLFALCLLF